MKRRPLIGVRLSEAQHLEILRESERAGCAPGRVLLAASERQRKARDLQLLTDRERPIVGAVNAHVSAECKRYTGG
jgi:hypothetical protein